MTIDIIDLDEENMPLRQVFADLLPERLLLDRLALDRLQPAKQPYQMRGAVCENQAVGVLVFRLEDEVVIDWLFVEPELRRQGIASKLVNSLREELEEELIFTDFTCEIEADDTGFGEDLIELFASLNDFTITPKCCIYEARPDDLKDDALPGTSPESERNAGVCGFLRQPDDMQKAFLSDRNVAETFCVQDTEAFYDDLMEDLSLCLVKNQEITSVILASEVDEDTISIDLVYSREPVKLQVLFGAFRRRLAADHPDARIIFRLVNERMEDVIGYFFNDLSIRGYVWEASTL